MLDSLLQEVHIIASEKSAPELDICFNATLGPSLVKMKV